MRFLMRFQVGFRVQNAPYPTLHEYFFREALRGLERKLSHIISRHPSFQFLLTWRYFVAELRDYKPVRGRLWQVLFEKSHRNRTKNRMCERAFRDTVSLVSHVAVLVCFDFWCDFAYKTHLTLPCTNAFFAKHSVDWKESHHILFEDALISNFC